MIHIYTGNGKGKTTLAMGMGLRAKIQGKRVFAVQFSDAISEIERKETPFEIHQVCKMEKSYADMTDNEKDYAKTEAKKGLTLCKLMCKKCNMLIMDEIFTCIDEGFIEEEELVDFINKLPMACELVMTGENVSKKIIDISDYVLDINYLKETEK